MTNTVFLFGPIDDDAAELLAVSVEQSEGKPLKIFISGDEGNVMSAFACYDIIRSHGNVTVVGTGLVEGAALLVFLAGDTRLATQNTIFACGKVDASKLNFEDEKSVIGSQMLNIYVSRFREDVLDPQTGVTRRVRRKVVLGSPQDMTERMARTIHQALVSEANLSGIKSPVIEKVKAKLVPAKKLETVDGIYARWSASVLSKRSNSTQLAYRKNMVNHLLPVMGKMRVQDVNTEDLQEVFDKLAKNKQLEGATLKQIWCSCSNMFKTAVAWGYCVKNPCKGVALPEVNHRIKKPVSIEELQKAMNEAGNDEDRLILYMLAETGIRLGEMCGLEIADFNLGKRTVHVQRNIDLTDTVGPTKTKQSNRILAMSKFLTQCVKKHIGERTSGPLFLPPIAEGHSRPETIRERVVRAFTKAGRSDATPHILRKLNATLMDELGLREKLRKQRLGHSTKSDITQHVYTYISSTAEQTAVENISTALLEPPKPEVVEEDLGPNQWLHLDPALRRLVCN